MKKYICIILVVIMLLSLAACGGEALEEPTSEPTQYLDMESISGYWKYDDYDYYFAIYAESIWMLYNMAGTEQYGGELTLKDDVMTLRDANGDKAYIFTVNNFDQLTDTEGDTLSRYNPSDDL